MKPTQSPAPQALDCASPLALSPLRPLAANPQIKVGVTAIILSDSGILLGIKRRPAKYAGKIVTPGGKLNFGETAEAGLRREVLEETGLTIRSIRRLPTLELIEPDEHIVFLCFQALVAGSSITAGDDLDAAGWYSFSCLKKCVGQMTPLTRQLLADFLS